MTMYSRIMTKRTEELPSRPDVLDHTDTDAAATVVTHRGSVYRFCSTACATQFRAHPDDFVAAIGFTKVAEHTVPAGPAVSAEFAARRCDQEN